jgi:DNA-binding response OmpR family regulator
MSKNILIVDDEQSALDYMKLACDAYGCSFKVDTASTIAEATSKLNSNKYDALVLDVSLPVINGNIYAVFVRKAFPKLPIAFLTNYSSEAASQIADEIHSEYWTKLSDFSLLQKCLEQLVQGNNCEGTIKVVDENAPEGTGQVIIPEEFQAMLQEG